MKRSTGRRHKQIPPQAETSSAFCSITSALKAPCCTILESISDGVFTIDLNKMKGHDDHRPMFSSREYEEAEKLRAVLEQYPKDRPAAANALGMSRTTLWRKMKRYDLLK